jgi:hypothetical protein
MAMWRYVLGQYERMGPGGQAPIYRISNLSLSIVCIHGLGGHREHTWTAEEPGTGKTTFWPRDLLPRDLPQARIMTYGYDSKVSSARYLAQRTLYSHSKAMLAELKQTRKVPEVSHRRLIFIAHSLGGILVKSALVHADKEENDFADIRLSTAGIFFFGTPHQGTSDKPWRQLLSDMIRRAVDLEGMRNTIETDSDWLQLQLEQYKPLSTSFQTFCFYEGDRLMQIPGTAVVRRPAL